MKLPTGPFRNEAPRLAKDELPLGYSEISTNCRILSGRLESWNDLLNEEDLPKGGNIVTIYPLDVSGEDGGPYWLHWNDAEIVNGQPTVDAMRGPIVGDDTERFYYTGLAEPRVSNLELATSETTPPAKDDPNGYPYRWFKWGVPAPLSPPTTAVNPAPDNADEVELDNPGAEDGTLFWNSNAGSLTSLSVADVPSLTAFEGTNYFSFGSAATSDFDQLIDFASEGIIPGSNLSIEWQQAKGPNDSTATLEIRYYDELSVLISTKTIPEIAPAGADYTWNARSFNSQVPSNATSARIAMLATKVGGGDTDAYIDDIRIYVAPIDYYTDCDTLSDWTVSPSSGARSVSVYDSETNNVPPGSDGNTFNFFADEAVPWIYKNFSMSVAQITISYEVYHAHQRVSTFLPIAVSQEGNGRGLAITAFAVEARDFSNQNDQGINGTTLGTGNFVGKWLVVTVTGTSNPTAAVPFYVTIEERDTGTKLLDNVQFSHTAVGDYLYLKHYSNEGGSTAQSWWDKISVSARPVEIDDQVTIGTAYVVVYKNDFGEISAPSDPSPTVIKNQDDTVTVSTITTAPAGYNITMKEIYRLSGIPAVYLFVASIPLAQEEYLDSKRDTELGAELESDENWQPPPTGAHHPVSAPNGLSAVLEKNRWIPSPINRPHALLQNRSLSFDFPAVVQGVIDNDFYVATHANPYVVTGSDPDGMTSSKLEKPQGCVSAPSAVVMEGSGFVYASRDGLTRVIRNDVALLTLGIISEREWRLLNPESIKGCTHDGKYFGFYDATSIGGTTGGFIFDPQSGGNGWSRLDFYATACAYNPYTDLLNLVIDGDRYVWDGNAAKRPSLWKSKEHVLPRYMSPTCFQVKANDYSSLTFKLFYDGVLFYTTTVTSDTERVLPPGRAKRIQYQLEGVFSVYEEPQIAERMEEIDNGPI